MDELIRKQDALDAAIKADMENHNGILSEKRARTFEEHIAILPPVQMDDAISRRAAIDATTETVFVEYEENADKEESIIRQTKAAIRDRIKALPTVQPNHNAEVSKMEIVRCENCEHWDTSWETVYGLHYCPMIDMATKKNFFCKYGAEKRGEADGRTD